MIFTTKNNNLVDSFVDDGANLNCQTSTRDLDKIFTQFSVCLLVVSRLRCLLSHQHVYCRRINIIVIEIFCYNIITTI